MTRLEEPGFAHSFRIRQMTLEDLGAVDALDRASFKHPWSMELLRRELAHEWSTIYLAEEPEEDRLLGFIVFWLVADEIHVLNLAVHPFHRRRGVAGAMLEAALERARQKKCSLATLEVRRSNEAALNLYRRFGFRQVGVRKNYYTDEGEDAIVMVADLG